MTLASLDPDRDAAQPQPQPAEADRRQLDASVSTACGRNADTLPEPQAAEIALKTRNRRSLDAGPRRARSWRARSAQASPAKAQPAGWAPAPEFDDDHPEELSYRPFPRRAAADAIGLGRRSGAGQDRASRRRKDARPARRQGQIVLPMRLRPGDQIAEVLWAQQFRGNAVTCQAHETASARSAGRRPRSTRRSRRCRVERRVARGLLRPRRHAALRTRPS